MSVAAQLHKKLGTFASTAIAGNDILSSALYVSGIAILFAGVYAPLVFLAVVGVLWLYKSVYIEVVEALPLNGGAYNCLLNATSKPVASVAGVMTILSYVATSVISAKTAAEYLTTLFSIPVLFVTAAVIVAFAVLVITGVKDSAKVAMGIFSFHIVTLSLFVIFGIFAVINHGWGHIPENMVATTSKFTQASEGGVMAEGMIKMLFLAFAASLLGVSGFESSANFVEEQEKGVFRKTLKMMLLGVLIFNPLIAFVVLHSLPIHEIVAAKDFILSDVAKILGGQAFQYMMVLDAFLVLSGAVLTSFVGASGLIYRMALDHCLPSSVLVPRLSHRNVQLNRIIIAFTLLCLSILLMTQGNLLSLAGVYTISFLGVMTMFAVGNIILRLSRPDLKRTYRAPLAVVLAAASCTILGIIGNILIDSKNIFFFSVYFLPALAMVLVMIYRDYVLVWLVTLSKRIPFIYKRALPLLEHVTRPKIIVFAHMPEKLFASLEYIRRNETSLNIVVVHCRQGVQSEDRQKILNKFNEYLKFFKEAKIFPQFNLELAIEEELPFGPEVVRKYASRFRLSFNSIFVGSIHESHPFDFEDLGGVRIIQ